MTLQHQSIDWLDLAYYRAMADKRHSAQRHLPTNITSHEAFFWLNDPSRIHTLVPHQNGPRCGILDQVSRSGFDAEVLKVNPRCKNLDPATSGYGNPMSSTPIKLSCCDGSLSKDAILQAQGCQVARSPESNRSGTVQAIHCS